MVWAISHVTRDAKYSKTLAEVAPRRHNPRERNDDEDSDSKDDGFKIEGHHKLQCRWTICNEDCPTDWTRMTRKDKKAPERRFYGGQHRV
ncbi:class V chitinase [Apiospora kogelbergensis]|uniref:class V chitinase n=1 Tax=Apiospora kogelbergensis TaxID=1337665 RepID=UPI003131A0F2